MGRILVTGGSGYLGQFIVKALCETGEHEVALTFNSRALSQSELELLGKPLAFPVNMRSGEGLERILEEFGAPDVVVNCAAISVPRECEKNPEAARAINIPEVLINWMQKFDKLPTPLFIHLSTDQVYEGSKSFYKEEDDAFPVNTYGQSKVAAEKVIREKCSNFAILRSSIIVGPEPPVKLSKGLPLQWIDSVLAKGEAVDFFGDEFRCPVFVLDVVKVVQELISASNEGKQFQELFNMGGPDRLSRAAMAEVVAQVRGHDLSLVKVVPAATVNRGVASPPDISMDITRLTSALGLALTPFKRAVEETFGAVAS